MDEQLGRRTAGGLLCTRGGSIVLFRQENVDRSSKRCCTRIGCGGKPLVNDDRQPRNGRKEAAPAASASASRPAAFRIGKSVQRALNSASNQEQGPGRNAAVATSQGSNDGRNKKSGRHDLLSRLKERVNATRRRSPPADSPSCLPTRSSFGRTRPLAATAIPAVRRAPERQPLDRRIVLESSGVSWATAVSYLDSARMSNQAWTVEAVEESYPDSLFDESRDDQDVTLEYLTNHWSNEPDFEYGAPSRARTYPVEQMFIDRHRGMRMDIDDMSYEELLALGERIGTVSTGLADDEIAAGLSTSYYSGKPQDSGSKKLETGDEKCTICQEEYAKDDALGEMACGHCYHRSCISEWLRMKNWCPVCRTAAAAIPLKP